MLRSIAQHMAAKPGHSVGCAACTAKQYTTQHSTGFHMQILHAALVAGRPASSWQACLAASKGTESPRLQQHAVHVQATRRAWAWGHMA